MPGSGDTILDGDQLEEHKVLISRVLRETLQNDENDLYAYEEAGLVGGDALDMLLLIEKHSKDYTKHPMYRKILRREVSKNLSEAVTDGNINVLGHAIGLGGGREKSEYRKIQRFRRLISHEGKVYYIDGVPNAGKTNTALFMAEEWLKAVDGEVASNISSVERFKTITDYDTLKEWLNEDGAKLYILDDASNHLSGYDSDRQVVETKMRKLTNFIAKKEASIVFIGHTGMDIHADIRRKARKIHKEGKRRAKMYDKIKRGEGSDLLIELKGLPETIIGYDPYEETKWTWGHEEEELSPEEIREAIKEEIESMAGKKNEIKRSRDLSAYKAQDAEKAMREWAKNRDKWRFFDNPHRLKAKVI